MSNFYEFKHNLPLGLKIKKSDIPRIESRKNIHYLDNHQSFVLSNPYDWKNIIENSDFNFSKCRFFQWDTKIHDLFMKKIGLYHTRVIQKEAILDIQSSNQLIMENFQ